MEDLGTHADRDGGAGDRHPSIDDLSGLKAGWIRGEAWENLNAHVRNCHACTEQLAFLDVLSATASQADWRADIGPHPTDESLLGLVEGSLIQFQRDGVVAHVSRCGPCGVRLGVLTRLSLASVAESKKSPVYAFPETRMSTPELIRLVKGGKSSPSVTPVRQTLAWVFAIAAAILIAVMVLHGTSSMTANRGGHHGENVGSKSHR